MKALNLDMKFKEGIVPAIVNADSITFIRSMEIDPTYSLISFDASEPIVVKHELIDLYEMLNNKGGRPKKNAE